MCSIIRHMTMQVPQNQYSRFSRRYLVQQAMGSERYKYSKAVQFKKRRHVSRSGTPDPPDLSRNWSNIPEDKSSYCSALMHGQLCSTFYRMSPRNRDSASIQYFGEWSKIKCPKLRKEMQQVFERAFRCKLPRNEEIRRQIRSESPTAQRRHQPATQRKDRSAKSRRSRDRAEDQEQEQVKERKRNMTVPGPLAKHGQAHNAEAEDIITKMETLIDQIGTSMISGWTAACDESYEKFTDFAERIRSLRKISEELSFLIDD